MFTIFNNCGCGDGTTTVNRADCICAKTYHNDCDGDGDDTPNPCGDDISIDLEGEGYVKIDACSGSVTYTPTYHDDEFSNVAISSEGVLTADINGDPDGQYELFYKLRCPEDGTSVNGRVVICVKNLCKQKDCTSTETCNECTGNCEASNADLEVE